MAFSAAAKYANVARDLQKIPARVSSQAAPAIEKMWRKSYRAQQDPYGKPWAKLAKSTIDRKGFDTILVESGDSYKATRVRPLPGAGIQLVTGEKLQWHLEATDNRPARPAMPLHGMPAPWRERIRKITVDAAKKAVRRG